ncbi:MAG: alpha/beta hydrolase [Opitutaceae bacterium]
MNRALFRVLAGCAALGGACLSMAAQTTPTMAARSAPLDPAMGIATVRLWNGPAPDAKGDGPADIPTLTVFRPAPRAENGTAVIVNPGGAYLGLAANLEGRQVADWFAVRGVTAFVLKYRMGGRYLYPVPLIDAERAVRWVRYHSREYHVARDRIGMAGFSAGGHLAAMVGTVGGPGTSDAPDPIDRLDSRPDFLVLGYPWLNAMEPSRPHFLVSYEELLHIPRNQWESMAARYTPVLHVTSATPPTFLYATTTDRTVPVEASVRFYSALVAHGVPAEMHLFGRGAHGSGLGRGDPALDRWPSLLGAWMRGRGLFEPDPAIAAEIRAARR